MLLAGAGSATLAQDRGDHGGGRPAHMPRLRARVPARLRGMLSGMLARTATSVRWPRRSGVGAHGSSIAPATDIVTGRPAATGLSPATGPAAALIGTGGYGEHLPCGYWVPQYQLADHRLFGLEVPHFGYEWVRVGDEALPIGLNTAIARQAECSVFG